MAQRVPHVSAALKTALEQFDKSLPDLKKMRNVGEHIDDYLLGRGRLREVQRQALQVSAWNGTVFTWLDIDLDIDIALGSAEALFSAITKSVRQYTDAAG